MALGPYAGFILAAYCAAIVIVGAMIVWIVADHRAQTRRLAELEVAGVMRRSAVKDAA